MKNKIRTTLINAGVKHLNEFGYKHANAENILTDELYSQFYLGMLKNTKEEISIRKSDVHEVIDELVNEIRNPKL